MATTVQDVDAPGDAELISAVRGGDVDAYGLLFERHVGAARRLARQLVSAGDVEDLVSDAFVKVLGVLQRGGGPDVAFRAYLLTSVRRLRVDRLRAGSRLQTSDDMEKFDPGVPFRDTAVEGFESEAAARAFASLPERWQLVLWHTEVEGQKPADVAPLLGMTPNSVSALAYRAREGLRQAFLNQHAQDVDEDTCRWTHEHLGGYIRNGLSRRDTGKVEGHLQDCRKCAAIYLELTEVNDNLAAILAPLLLGGAAAAYVGSSGAAAGGGLVALLDRAKDTLGAQGAVAAGGVAATVVVAAGIWAVTLGGERRHRRPGPRHPVRTARRRARHRAPPPGPRPTGRRARRPTHRGPRRARLRRPTRRRSRRRSHLRRGPRPRRSRRRLPRRPPRRPPRDPGRAATPAPGTGPTTRPATWTRVLPRHRATSHRPAPWPTWA